MNRGAKHVNNEKKIDLACIQLFFNRRLMCLCLINADFRLKNRMGRVQRYSEVLNAAEKSLSDKCLFWEI